MTESCYRCGKSTSETMIVDGQERTVCEICKLASRVMHHTRMPAEAFAEKIAGDLRDAARDLAQSVKEEREGRDQ